VIYASPADFRRALEDRLGNRARTDGISLDRLRRQVMVERILARLEHSQPGRWILKGGMALEYRLGNRARATRDLDLALRATIADGARAHTDLMSCLSTDPFSDGFVFRVRPPRQVEIDDPVGKCWRFGIEAALAGRRFQSMHIDLVVRAEEARHTERLTVPSLLAFAGFPSFEVEAIDRRQHFAEKLHALTRTFGTRPSSRAWDLADLLLLMGDGLPPNASLRGVVEEVFTTRGSHPLPSELPDPPAEWTTTYPPFAESLGLAETTTDTAMTALRAFWSRALNAQE
jgi:hypothetical protein